MGKFWCNYCGMKLTKDSARVRNQHFKGKNHILNVEIYWKSITEDLKATQSARERLDQTTLLRSTFKIPGLTASLDNHEVENALDKAHLPAPAHY